MSEYTPTVWKTGDIITAEKLNNIEEGIANAGGGESDFTTAQVTVVNESAQTEDIYIPYIEEAIEEQQPAYAGAAKSATASETTVFTAILYKGTSMAVLTSGNLIITGEASSLSASAVAITGDCTITIETN